MIFFVSEMNELFLWHISFLIHNQYCERKFYSSRWITFFSFNSCFQHIFICFLDNVMKKISIIFLGLSRRVAIVTKIYYLLPRLSVGERTQFPIIFMLLLKNNMLMWHRVYFSLICSM